jgi:hypothetical protein
MKHRLSCTIIVLLLATTLTYSSTLAYNNGQKCDTEVTVTISEVTVDGEAASVAICEISDTECRSRLATLKSSLRAGVAVGKAIGKTALIVAQSVGRAARHATVALFESATA